MTFEKLHREIRGRGWLWGVEPVDWLTVEADSGKSFGGVVWCAWIKKPDGRFEQEGSDPLGCLRLAYEAARAR